MIPSASRDFSLVGSDAASPAQLRGHLLRSRTLRLKMFESKDAAELWVAESAHAGASGTSLVPPAPSPHSFAEGSLLRTVSPAGEAMYDLADCTSASSFFFAVGTSTHDAGPRSQGVPLIPKRSLDQPLDVRKRRRLEVVAQGAPDVAGACDTVNLPATAATGAGVASGHTLFSSPASFEEVSLRKRVRPRPLMSWSYFGTGCMATGGKDNDGPHLLDVGTAAVDVGSPVSVFGNTLRTVELLAGGTSVFSTGPPGCGKTYVTKEVINALRDYGHNVSACGSTGVAAALVDGIKAHSWTRFCNGDADVAAPLDVLLHKVIPMAAEARISSAMVLVVDEVGTLSAAFLKRLD